MGPPHYSTVVQDCWQREAPYAAEPGLRNYTGVHVVYASDGGHFRGLLASMLSLARQLSSPESCTIHLLVGAAGMRKAREVASCFRAGLRALPAVPTVTFHELRPLGLNTSGLRASNPFREDLVLPETLARVHLHRYLRKIPRVIWMDTDTIVKADVAPLYRIRMRHAIAAVPLGGVNRGLRSQVNVRHRLTRDMIDWRDAPAFNAGVAVYDLTRWRPGSLTRQLEHWVALQTVPRLFKEGLEQGPMNLVFRGAFDQLDWRWNVMGLGWWAFPLPPPCVEEARVLHWTGAAKPWDPNGFHQDLFEDPGHC